MDLQLGDKRVLVTGSNGGIGEGIATILAREGATVVIHGRDEGRVRATARTIKETGGRVFMTHGDLATDAGAKAVVDATLAQVGGVDILVNNAGGNESTAYGGWFGFSPDEWASVAQKNTISSVRLIHALVPAMRDRAWGRVINISSAGGTQAEAHTAHYCASKAAINNMTVSLSKALARSGVTVNTISPGAIRTPAFEKWLMSEGRSRGWQGDTFEDFEVMYLKEMRPLSVNRIGRVEDIGAVAAFLASPLAAFITGANFRVDGGQVLAIN